MKFFRLLKPLITIGSHVITDERKRHLCINVNTISLISALLAITLAPTIYLFTGQKMILFPALLESVLFGGVIYLNYLQKYTLANIGFYILQYTSVIYFSIILGRMAEAQLMAIFLVGLAMLIFSNIYLRAFCVFITLMGLLLLELNYYFEMIDVLPIPHEQLLIIRWIAYPVVVFLNILVLLNYERNNNKLIRQLEQSAIKLEAYSRIQEEANRAKTDFVREISHEIRTPLNAIFSISQLLKMDMQYNEQLKAFKPEIIHLHAACYNVQTIINDVLELARIESGKQDEPLVEYLYLPGLLADIVDVCQYIASLKSITLLLVVAKDFPADVMGDKTRLVQVINNLLTNAIKFTAHSSTVTLTLIREKETYVLTVQDQGKGIASDKLADIFEPYVSEHSDFIKGTGLGLHIVKRLVESMNGTITVSSLRGMGACFAVYLPLMEDHEKGEIAPILQQVVANSYNHQKILVIEDDRMSQVYIAQYLERLNLVVVVADDGKEGLSKTYEHHPDIILMDMQLPDMSGLDILKQLQADPLLKKIPVLAVSGDAFKEVRDAAIYAGAKEFIIKPVDFRILHLALNKYLNEQSAKETEVPFALN
ncbi:Signal transduction histidine kinase [Chitinophaga sp. CF118]|uniref:ATP-binding protein n=1 Tax=Chitinophaga sp. CF118 TaxID=1884367 RepID=UPI0008EA8EB3|nr:ATP-binding protein [Chitinophaga sp. CF118]SFD02405.1 Signal transduction histidine kinase [Chitinophaga sp. CF118]